MPPKAIPARRMHAGNHQRISKYQEKTDQNQTCFSSAASTLLCELTADWLALSCLDDLDFFLVLWVALLTCVPDDMPSTRPL